MMSLIGAHSASHFMRPNGQVDSSAAEMGKSPIKSDFCCPNGQEIGQNGPKRAETGRNVFCLQNTLPKLANMEFVNIHFVIDSAISQEN